MHATNLKRSVVTKQVEKAEWAMADRWSADEEEIIELRDLLREKKIGES